jgi:hypothetical protein
MFAVFGAERSQPTQTRKRRIKNAWSLAKKARGTEDLVATFVVPVPNGDFDKVGDEGCDKGAASELLERAQFGGIS